LQIKPFEASFRYDGATLTRGKTRLHVSKCEVEGIDFEVPVEYAALLLYEETKNEAWRFLKEASKSPIMDSVRTALLRTVCREGFEKTWRILKAFNHEAPCGKPRFYSEPRDNTFRTPTIEWKVNNAYITLTDGDVAFRFYASSQLKSEVLRLPLNVYCQPTSIGFTLTPKHLKAIIGNKGEFFEFVEMLEQTGDYVSEYRKRECYKKFFEDRKKAYEMLKTLNGDANRRIRRDELFRTLKNRRILEFSKGFFVHDGWWNTYYVTKNGEVYRLKYDKPVDVREAVQRGVEKGRPPRKIEPVEKKWVLREIAKTVGSVKPELALVISP